MDGAEAGWCKNPLDLEEEIVDVGLRDVLQCRDRVNIVDAIIGKRDGDAILE